MAGFSEDAPFTHTLNIVLRGTTDPNDPDNVDMPMPDGTPDVGWKAMGKTAIILLLYDRSGSSYRDLKENTFG